MAKNCIICGADFPSSIIIDGQRHRLDKRKKCFDCSPFNSHNKKPNRDVICVMCGRKYYFDAAKGHTEKKCNSCMVNSRRPGRKQKAVVIKGGKCKICGYNKCIRSLTFHHVDPATKNFEISDAKNRSWETILIELDKCVLLCNNCHGEVHDGLITVELDLVHQA